MAYPPSDTFVKALAAIRDFLACVKGKGEADVADLELLQASVDRILAAARSMKPVEPFTSHAPEPAHSTPDYASIKARFAVLEETQSPGVDPWVDIEHPAADLCKVAAYASANRLEEAQWEFKRGFATHWGMHLASLRLPLLKAIRKQTL